MRARCEGGARVELEGSALSAPVRDRALARCAAPPNHHLPSEPRRLGATLRVGAEDGGALMVELRPFSERTRGRNGLRACAAGRVKGEQPLYQCSRRLSRGHRFSPAALLWRRLRRWIPVTLPGSDGAAGDSFPASGPLGHLCSQAEDAGLRFASWETCLCVCVCPCSFCSVGQAAGRRELPGKCIPSALAPKELPRA